MSVQLVDSGVHAAANLNGVLQWSGAVDGGGQELAYDGVGNVYALVAFTECSNFWLVPSSGNYQYVKMTWSQDLGVVAYEYFAELWVCMDVNVGTPVVTGYRAMFYNDGTNGFVEFYDYSGLGSSFLSNASGAQFAAGDTLALEYDDTTTTLQVYVNGVFFGSVSDSSHLGNKYQAIGSMSSNAEFNNIYMEQPSGGGGPWTILPTGKATSQAFGVPTILKTVLPAGFSNAGRALGAPTIAKTVLPTGKSTTQALGAPTIAKVVTPSGIPSGQAFGTPTIIGGAAPGINGRDLPLLGAGR